MVFLELSDYTCAVTCDTVSGSRLNSVQHNEGLIIRNVQGEETFQYEHQGPGGTLLQATDCIQTEEEDPLGLI